MAMKDGELVIWDIHPCYTVFHEQTETFSSLWSELITTISGSFLHIYSQDVACYGENWPISLKGFIENMFFVSSQSPGEFHQFLI